MGMLGHHPVAEPLVEGAVAGELAPHAHPHLVIPLGGGISVGPLHQRPSDAVALVRRVDGHPSNMQVARLSLESKAADRSPVDGCEQSPVAGQVVADIRFGLSQGAAGWIERAIASEGEPRQAVEIGGALGTA